MWQIGVWQIRWFSTLDAKNVRMENISWSSPIGPRRLTLIYMKYWETCWELYWRLGVYKSKKSREKNTPNRRRLGDLSSTGRPNPDQWDPAKDPNRPQKFFDVHFSIHLSLRTGEATHEGSFLIIFSKYHSIWITKTVQLGSGVSKWSDKPILSEYLIRLYKISLLQFFSHNGG